MSWRRSPAASSGPSAALAARFHDALRAGDVALVRELVFREPRLANARDPARERFRATPIMSATLCCSASARPSGPRRSDGGGASRATVLVNLLVAKGAKLQTKDDRKWQALMFACANGAHPSVVRCLLDCSRKEGGRAAAPPLSWGDTDVNGRTALTLACANGHGRLAAYVLDRLLTDGDWDEVHHPLRLLAVAIESQDERSAVELLRAREVEWAVAQDRGGVERMAAHGEWSQVDSRQDGDASVAVCVAGAVNHGMSRVIEEMHALNAERVGRATWLTVYRLQTHEKPSRKTNRRRREAAPAPTVAVPRGIATVIDLYKRDRVWQSVRLLFAIRFKQVRGAARSRSTSTVRCVQQVANLPDDVFRSVVEYVKIPFDDDAEAQKEHFRVLMVQDSW